MNLLVKTGSVGSVVDLCAIDNAVGTRLLKG